MAGDRVAARRLRARALKAYGTLGTAVEAGAVDAFQAVSLSEALVMGLVNQGVRLFIGVFGHGSTDVTEVLRIYQDEGLVRTAAVHSEVEAVHAASALKWQYGRTAAVVTSIGPGALHALAGSLTALSNGLGLYILMGDETSHGEGPNMQQIPRREQELFLRLAGTMGPAMTIHTPEAIFTALKRGNAAVHAAGTQSPFFLLLPMNVQPLVMERCNLREFPEARRLPMTACVDDAAYAEAARLLVESERVTVKVGRGARTVDRRVLEDVLERSDAVYVHSPNLPGLLPASHRRNMTVGGSKGSISGNYAMAECDLLVVIGARGVCQWDSSGTAFPKARRVININTDPGDLAQYNRSLALPGDAGSVLERLGSVLAERGAAAADRPSAWWRPAWRSGGSGTSSGGRDTPRRRWTIRNGGGRCSPSPRR